MHGVSASVRRSLVIVEQPAKRSQQHDTLRVTQVVQKANNITAKVRLLLPWHAYCSLVARPELPAAAAEAADAATHACSGPRALCCLLLMLIADAYVAFLSMIGGELSTSFGIRVLV